jgi:hypothetical protein
MAGRLFHFRRQRGALSKLLSVTGGAAAIQALATFSLVRDVCLDTYLSVFLSR